VVVPWSLIYQGDEVKAEYFGGSCSVTKIDTIKFLIRKPEVKDGL
jgi:hypothetical protein